MATWQSGNMGGAGGGKSKLLRKNGAKDAKAALLSSEKKEYAQRCTRDAERRLESLSRILREGIELDTVWIGNH